jgi:hypothetical protein
MMVDHCTTIIWDFVNIRYMFYGFSLSLSYTDANPEDENSRIHNKNWTQPNKPKIKLKRTWSNDFMYQRIIIVRWKSWPIDCNKPIIEGIILKTRLIDYNEPGAKDIRMNAIKK